MTHIKALHRYDALPWHITFPLHQLFSKKYASTWASTKMSKRLYRSKKHMNKCNGRSEREYRVVARYCLGHHLRWTLPYYLSPIDMILANPERYQHMFLEGEDC